MTPTCPVIKYIIKYTFAVPVDRNGMCVRASLVGWVLKARMTKKKFER